MSTTCHTPAASLAYSAYVLRFSIPDFTESATSSKRNEATTTTSNLKISDEKVQRAARTPVILWHLLTQKEKWTLSEL